MNRRFRDEFWEAWRTPIYWLEVPIVVGVVIYQVMKWMT